MSPREWATPTLVFTKTAGHHSLVEVIVISKVFRQDKDDLCYDARTANKEQKAIEIKVRSILYGDQQ